MQKTITPFLIILQLFTLLASQTVLGESDLPRHIDPSILTSESPYSIQLFGLYDSIFSFLKNGNYTEARYLINSVMDIYVPSDAKGLFDDYNDYLIVLAENLEYAEFDINGAWGKLSWLQDTLAEDSLENALIHLSDANVTVASLGDASIEVGDFLKVSPELLLQGLDGIVLRLVDYRNEVLLAQDEVCLINGLKNAGLKETNIQIESSLDDVLIGETVSLSGTLMIENGTVLPQKDVDVFIESTHLGKYTTNSVGSFNTSIVVPYIYTGSASIHAEYWPDGDDITAYVPSTSNQINLGLSYYVPTIEFDIPEAGYPSQTFTLTGEISYLDKPLSNISIEAFSFWKTLRTVSNADGLFQINIDTPNDIGEGMSKIIVESLPSGVFGSASLTGSIEVKRLPLTVDYDVASWSYSGGSTSIDGKVSAEGVPLSNCSITVKMGSEILNLITEKDGSFSANLKFSIDTLSSSQSYTLNVIPQEPWISSGSYSGSVYVVNVFTIFGLPLFLGAVFFSGFRRYLGNRKHPPGDETSDGESLSDYADDVEHIGIVGIYLSSLRLIRRYTKSLIRPEHTIREYLTHVQDKLESRIYRLFEQLSILYEKWLYGRREDKKSVESAEKMLEEIEDNLEYEN